MVLTAKYCGQNGYVKIDFELAQVFGTWVSSYR